MNLLGNKERCFIMLPLFQTITDIPLALFKNFTCCCSEPMQEELLSCFGMYSHTVLPVC